MSRFYQDRNKQIFEETTPGRLRGVTDMAGDRYISEQTVPKSVWGDMRGPLVEVPDPWTSDGVKLLRVEEVVARWESLRTKPGSAPHAYLLAEIKAALGHHLPEEEPQRSHPIHGVSNNVVQLIWMGLIADSPAGPAITPLGQALLDTYRATQPAPAPALSAPKAESHPPHPGPVHEQPDLFATT